MKTQNEKTIELANKIDAKVHANIGTAKYLHSILKAITGIVVGIGVFFGPFKGILSFASATVSFSVVVVILIAYNFFQKTLIKARKEMMIKQNSSVKKLDNELQTLEKKNYYGDIHTEEIRSQVNQHTMCFPKKAKAGTTLPECKLYRKGSEQYSNASREFFGDSILVSISEITQYNQPSFVLEVEGKKHNLQNPYYINEELWINAKIKFYCQGHSYQKKILIHFSEQVGAVETTVKIDLIVFKKTLHQNVTGKFISPTEIEIPLHFLKSKDVLRKEVSLKFSDINLPSRKMPEPTKPW